MSMSADIIDVFRESVDSKVLSEDSAIDMYIDICGALEWSFDGVDYLEVGWMKKERDAAKKELRF